MNQMSAWDLTYRPSTNPPSNSSSGSSSCTDYVGSGDTGNSDGAMDQRVDRRARKKDQNRRAAYNYRRKKMEERDRMIEEEARLVHKHVRLTGKIARIERKILLILSTKTAKIVDKEGQILCYTCPICLKFSCENIQTLRNHLKAQHLQQKLLDDSSAAAISQKCHILSYHLDTLTKTTLGWGGDEWIR